MSTPVPLRKSSANKSKTPLSVADATAELANLAEKLPEMNSEDDEASEWTTDSEAARQAKYRYSQDTDARRESFVTSSEMAEDIEAVLGQMSPQEAKMQPLREGQVSQSRNGHCATSL